MDTNEHESESRPEKHRSTCIPVDSCLFVFIRGSLFLLWVGNHLKYAGILRGDEVEIAYPPEVWIGSFGPRLAKIHV